MEKLILSTISLDEISSRLLSDFKSEFFPLSREIEATDEDLLTAKQTAKWLGVSLVTLYKWKKLGKIKFHRFGTRIRFKKSEILNVSKFNNPKKNKEV